MSDKYVFVMKELNKTWPGGKQVIKDGWLSFYPGAKIGVLGSNGLALDLDGNLIICQHGDRRLAKLSFDNVSQEGVSAIIEKFR